MKYGVKTYKGFEFLDNTRGLCIMGIYLSHDKSKLLIETLSGLLCFRTDNEKIKITNYKDIREARVENVQFDNKNKMHFE